MGGPFINPDGKAIKPPLPDSTPLLPCPFCGSDDIDPAGWASTDRHGPACMVCSGSADTIELWNSRPLIATIKDQHGNRNTLVSRLGCSFCHEPDTHKHWCPKLSNVPHGRVI